MTRTLVLTVDRDNDLGVKTGIRGPVVGRRQVMAAALKLGIADPEESDTNAILGALSQHDNLVEHNSEEEEVEIAILTGDEKVGIRSDRAVAAQLEEVVAAFQPDLLLHCKGLRRPKMACENYDSCWTGALLARPWNNAAKRNWWRGYRWFTVSYWTLFTQ
jgi:hypothetical protein